MPPHYLAILPRHVSFVKYKIYYLSAALLLIPAGTTGISHAVAEIAAKIIPSWKDGGLAGLGA